jgi:methionine-S-sulfoxide reductase
MSIEMITLGGGCFWCTEAVYEHVDGVTAVESGYSNGHVAKPTYEQVCSGATGCVEVIRVAFDADRISLREVLEIFFVIHDPTTPNRQGNDVGTQYRSGIYVHDAAQQAVAREVMRFEVEFVDALGQVAPAEELDVYVERMRPAGAVGGGGAAGAPPRAPPYPPAFPKLSPNYHKASH